MTNRSSILGSSFPNRPDRFWGPSSLLARKGALSPVKRLRMNMTTRKGKKVHPRITGHEDPDGK